MSDETVETVETDVDPFAALLAAVKTYLQITWTDEETDARLTELMNAGREYIDQKLWDNADYAIPGLPRTLLFEYVRYARDGALDVFENNYQRLLLAMQNQKGVRDYAGSVEGAETP